MSASAMYLCGCFSSVGSISAHRPWMMHRNVFICKPRTSPSAVWSPGQREDVSRLASLWLALLRSWFPDAWVSPAKWQESSWRWGLLPCAARTFWGRLMCCDTPLQRCSSFFVVCLGSFFISHPVFSEQDQASLCFVLQVKPASCFSCEVRNRSFEQST